MLEPNPKRWYALAVHARQEKAAATALSERGVDVFLPLRSERRAWSDRFKQVQIALFPGYLFVRVGLTARTWADLLQARQITDIVGRLAGGQEVARHIPDVDIESLKAAVASRRYLDPVARLVRGTRVRVASGPLKGAYGVVEESADRRRALVVQIELLGRGVRAELSGDDLVEAV